MIYDAGSNITIEVEFRKHTPFVGEALFNPTSASIQVTDPDGTVVLPAVSLVNNAIGQYYFNVQTVSTWIAGIYIVQVSSSDGVGNDITINPTTFELK